MNINMKKNGIGIILAVTVLSGGLGFVGGMKYQETKQPSATSPFSMRNRTNGINQTNGTNGTKQQGTRSGMQPVSGEITAIDATSITVKTMDGSSKIILLSGSTTINTSTEGTVSDLTTGKNVMVLGTTNSDGTMAASTISLGDRGFGGPGGAGNGPAQQQ